MSYVVLGCGAAGGLLAAALTQAGQEVLVSDADPAVVEAVSLHGLRLAGPAGAVTVRVPAVLPAALPASITGPVLVAVRAPEVAAAAGLLSGRLRGGGYAVALQPGPGAAVLTSALGPQRVLAAVTTVAAHVAAPGVVRHAGAGVILAGELDGRLSERARALAAAIPGAQATAQLSGCQWAGLARYAVLAATAVSPQPAAAVLGDPRYAPLLQALAREVLAQAPVTPVPVDGFDPADLPAALARLARSHQEPGAAHAPAYWDLTARGRPAEVPAVLGPLAAAGGRLLARLSELVQAIEAGRRPCAGENLELLAGYERLERLGRPLNAVAAAAPVPDRPGRGPLAGRLAAVKDIIAVAGLPTRCGSPASDPAPAARDATVVARLRAAGAEVFATSQCLEYAAGFAHPAVGDTRNPLDPSRTSGGSSGGSAALVAAGVCGLALGTDTGGSVRIPAAYCGVTGLKPSYGLLPVDGVFPLSPSCDHVGTLTSTAAAAAELLAVLAPGLAAASPADAGRPPVIGVLAAQLADRSVTPPVRAALTAALARLAEAGWEVRELSPRWLAEPGRWEETLAVIVASEAAQVHAGRATVGYAEGTRALLAYGATVTPQRLARAKADRAELTAAAGASLAGVDALAGPTVGFQAPAEDPPFGVGEDSGEGRFTGPWNLTGHPAVSLPVPAAGLPAGLQLAGRRGADLALLGLAAAAEKLIGYPARAAGPAPAMEG